MLRVTSEKRTPKAKRPIRFPGICAAAEQLGITREHAYRVLTGERKSRALVAKLAKRGLTPVLGGGR
jgi:hypothetical protein